MKIRIAHSPDSDDAFMFYGLASGRVPSLGYELEHVLGDIETLNHAAFEGTYEITAVSFHAYAHLTDRYILLPQDRRSTRLNSSHLGISYAVFCLKKKKNKLTNIKNTQS